MKSYAQNACGSGSGLGHFTGGPANRTAQSKFGLADAAIIGAVLLGLAALLGFICLV
jgi:hypothetical protein